MDEEIKAENVEMRDFEEELSSMDDNSKLALLIDELKNENFNIRLYCVKRLTFIAELLGPERTEEELLPLIIDLIVNFEDNEEVLFEVSEQLVKLAEYITNRSNLAFILRGLELLSGNDDETVRQHATDSLCNLIKMLDENVITNDIFPLMQRLIQNDMKSKVSCCYLFPVVYPKLNNEAIKKELIQAYYEISRDDSPSVRRAAAHNIKNFADINDTDLLKELVALHSDLLRDNIDIVKVFATESTKTLIKALPEDQQKKIVINFNQIVNKDKSWRVKYAAAEAICEMSKYFDVAFNEAHFLPMIMLFLKDPEPEVRASVVSKLPQFISKISTSKFISNLIPILNDNISTDNNHHVKALFASTLLIVCKYIDENTFEKYIYPLLTKVLKDDILEVKNSALQHFDELAAFFKKERIMINIILPIVSDISKDSKWRIRLQLAENLSKFLDRCTRDNFISYFIPIVNNYFNDHAYQIREIAINIYEKIMKSFTIKEANELKLFCNTIWELQNIAMYSNNYIIRISAISSVNKLKCFFTDEFIINTIFPFLFLICNDKVPNVKFTLANLLKNLTIYLNDKKALIMKNELLLINKEVKNILVKYSTDFDIDVKYFSLEALEYLNKY